MKEIHIDIKMEGKKPSEAESGAAQEIRELIQSNLGNIVDDYVDDGVIGIVARMKEESFIKLEKEIAAITVRRGIQGIIKIETEDIDEGIEELAEKIEHTEVCKRLLKIYKCETLLELFVEHFYEVCIDFAKLEYEMESEDFAVLLIIAATIQPDVFFNLYAERPIEGIEDTGMESIIKNEKALQAALEVAKKRSPDSKIPDAPEAGMPAQVTEDTESLEVMKDLESTDDGERILGAAEVDDINEIWGDSEKVHAAINIVDTFQWRIDILHVKTFLLMAAEHQPDTVIEFYENFRYSGITNQEVREDVISKLQEQDKEVDPKIFVAKETE